MSDTLVIHPKDPSTDFLEGIYFDKDFDVIRDGNIDEDILIKEIENHDTIIMMGHGTPMGLINPNFWSGKGINSDPFIINKYHVDLLSTKKTISIWCNSDKFYELNNLSDGNLHTGMIISEVMEELICLKDIPLDEDEILDNMNLFAKAVHDSIDLEPEKMVENILSIYDGDDDVTQFNRKNIKLV